MLIIRTTKKRPHFQFAVAQICPHFECIKNPLTHVYTPVLAFNADTRSGVSAAFIYFHVSYGNTKLSQIFSPRWKTKMVAITHKEMVPGLDSTFLSLWSIH